MKKTIPLILVASIFAGCGKDTSAPEPPALRPAYTFKVSAPTDDIIRSFSGQVAASESSQVAFQVGGRIISVAAKAGETYAAGDELARIDPADYQAALDEAQARHAEARNNLIRTQNLFENGNASKSQLDTARSAEQSARSALETATKRVADCTLTMPYNGVIGRVNINLQETVSVGQGVMSILANGGSLEFNIGVPADLIEEISLNLPGAVEVGAFEGKVLDAVVSEIGAEPKDNTTYPVTFKLSSQLPGLREGMDGEVSVLVNNPEGSVMTIPLSCVAAQPGDASYVYKVTKDASGSQGTVERQVVSTGSVRENGHVEITEGLSEGDLVVSRGVHRLEPGTTVLLRDGMQSE